MMTDTKQVHESFPAFMQQVVLPMHLAQPGHARLDGMKSVGNGQVVGRFRYKDRVWKVHMDSHYEPLLLAYCAWQYMKLGEETFVEEETTSGRRLDLVSAVNEQRRAHYRYLYIYLDEA